MSVNVDFDKLDRKKFNKEFVFVTEDGKTAECFEEIGKNYILFMYNVLIKLIFNLIYITLQQSNSFCNR